MSIFISIFNQNTAYMIADSRSTGSDGTIHDEHSQKIHQFGSKLLIGTGGNAEIGDYFIRQFKRKIGYLAKLSIEEFTAQAKSIIANEIRNIERDKLLSHNASFFILGVNSNNIPGYKVVHTSPDLHELTLALNNEQMKVAIEPPLGLSQGRCYAELLAKLHLLSPKTQPLDPELYRCAAHQVIRTLSDVNPYINSICQEGKILI